MNQNNRGASLAQAGQVDETIACFKKALALDPKHGAAHYGPGHVLGKKGDLDGAERAFREAVRLDGDRHGAAIDALATLLVSRGGLDGAVAVYKEILRIAPKDAKAHAILGAALAESGLGLLHQRQWAEAEPLLRGCLASREKVHPDEWTTFNTQSLLGQKKYAEAEPLFLQGYEGLKAREDTSPKQGGGERRISAALGRLIELYTALNKPDEAKRWQAEQAKYPVTKEPETKN